MPYKTSCVLLLGRLASSYAHSYASNQVPVVKDSTLVAANFPNLTHIKLLSPSFVHPETIPSGFANGTSGPTDLVTLDNFLQTLASRNSWMTYQNPDFQSEEGRTLPHVFLSKPSQDRTAPRKVRIWMQGGVHGNEPAGDQGLLALLGEMDENPKWADDVLDKVEILMVPRYNPDGVAYFQRYLATSLDPNRDHTKQASLQTSNIKHLAMEFAPHVGLDCHEYTATRYVGANKQWIPAKDAEFSAMKNLNIHPDIRNLSETLFVGAIATALDKEKLRWGPYVDSNEGTDDLVLEETSSDAKVGDSSIALGQAVMFLSETRGIGLADQHWQRRVATSFTIARTIVETVVKNAEHVLDVVEKSRADFIKSDREIVVTDSAKKTEILWQYIDARNGSLVDVPVTFMNTTALQANLTRSRPEAYVFSRAFSAVVPKLRAAGLVVEELRATFSGQVEALLVTNASIESVKYEGIARTTVVTKTVYREVSIPAGGFWVSTRQKNAAHAFSVLEPENIDSYASFNLIPVNTEDEYPIYRVMK